MHIARISCDGPRINPGGSFGLASWLSAFAAGIATSSMAASSKAAQAARCGTLRLAIFIGLVLRLFGRLTQLGKQLLEQLLLLQDLLAVARGPRAVLLDTVILQSR